jgi:hypothetical protein
MKMPLGDGKRNQNAQRFGFRSLGLCPKLHTAVPPQSGTGCHDACFGWSRILNHPDIRAFTTKGAWHRGKAAERFWEGGSLRLPPAQGIEAVSFYPVYRVKDTSGKPGFQRKALEMRP